MTVRYDSRAQCFAFQQDSFRDENARALALCPRLSLRTPARSAHTRSRSNAHTCTRRYISRCTRTRIIRLSTCLCTCRVSAPRSGRPNAQSTSYVEHRKQDLHLPTCPITPSSWHAVDHCNTAAAAMAHQVTAQCSKQTLGASVPRFHVLVDATVFSYPNPSFTSGGRAHALPVGEHLSNTCERSNASRPSSPQSTVYIALGPCSASA
ncbi:hypothetical protein EXIGLDRAFT_724246 [Exidia glandulosa HHB12029]|uniref:Uncharacterized protein n=1 Tax=Exidia glandulosa HHB12029 TaxID=1314781 RepID=A0A165MS80_EXIGL|nr:hypothetical protein EXIGLDRAFT_724246 [Exidia glandulosa HHB12029]